MYMKYCETLKLIRECKRIKKSEVSLKMCVGIARIGMIDKSAGMHTKTLDNYLEAIDTKLSTLAIVREIINEGRCHDNLESESEEVIEIIKFYNKRKQ